MSIEVSTLRPIEGFRASLGGTQRILLIVLGLAAANFGAGHLGLLLSVPPGFATALFPPAGISLWAMIAFGPRVAPGVFLGSLLLNLSIAPDISAPGAWQVAAGIALGSTLQALLGAWLIGGDLGRRAYLGEPERVVRILLLGGPVSCMVAATCGMAVLVSSNIVPMSVTPWNWFTWWVGDTLGVLVFTPTLLLAVNPSVSLRRLTQVSIPLLCALALAIAAFSLIYGSEQRRQMAEFTRNAEMLATSIKDRVSVVSELLESLQSYMRVSDRVTRAQFGEYLAPVLARHPEIQAMSWAPRVMAGERVDFEGAARRQLAEAELDELFAYSVWQRGANGELTAAQPRPDYYPVWFSEPSARAGAVAGWDIGSEVSRRRALERAFETGELTATEPVNLVTGKKGLLLIAAVAKGGSTRNGSLLGAPPGVVLGVFRMADLVRLERVGPVARSLGVRIRDADVPLPDGLLYDNHPAAEVSGKPALSYFDAYETRLAVGGRSWIVTVAPTLDFVEGLQSNAAWLTLIGGLAFTTLVGGFCLVLTGRMAEVQTLVEERTRDLARANERLQSQNLDLNRSNEELDRFAYVASHDLKAPLRAVSQVAQWIDKDAGALLPERSREHLALLRGRVSRMGELLDGLLAYSRAGREGGESVSIDTGELVEEVIQFLSPPSGFTLEVQPGMPILNAQKVPLFQVFQNLINNAVKHHDRKEGRIDIGWRLEGAHAVFEIKDDGPGIPQESRERVFQIFETLRSRDEVEGSGMGLSIVKKVVENHGGRIWIESDGERGTSFLFTWLKQPMTTPEEISA